LVARGFRAGGFNSITTPAPFSSYQPERTTNFEGGLKTELFDRRLRLNGAVFYTKYTDILLTDITRGTDGSQTVYSKNGGKARSYGAELEGALRVTRQFTVSGGYTYLNFRNTTGGVSQQVTGFAPHTFNVQGDFLQPIGHNLTFGAHASASYIGKTPTAQQVILRDAHAITDASVDISYLGATLSVFGKNVFNERYYTSYIPAAFTALRTSSLGLLNRPAEYGVRLSAHF
jgi:iron complex outermembrane receptor protein